MYGVETGGDTLTQDTNVGIYSQLLGITLRSACSTVPQQPQIRGQPQDEPHRV